MRLTQGHGCVGIEEGSPRPPPALWVAEGSPGQRAPAATRSREAEPFPAGSAGPGQRHHERGGRGAGSLCRGHGARMPRAGVCPDVRWLPSGQRGSGALGLSQLGRPHRAKWGPDNCLPFLQSCEGRLASTWWPSPAGSPRQSCQPPGLRPTGHCVVVGGGLRDPGPQLKSGKGSPPLLRGKGHPWPSTPAVTPPSLPFPLPSCLVMPCALRSPGWTLLRPDCAGRWTQIRQRGALEAGGPPVLCWV